MIDRTITLARMVAALKAVAADLKDHAEELRKLDALIGDGDLGVTAQLAADAMTAFLEAQTETDIGKLLAKCGLSINKASPSTFGTLLAAGFLGAGKSAQNKTELSAQNLAAIGQGAVDGIKNRGKAEVGDKTMLDSLVPAVETFKNKIGEGIAIGPALDAAVKAAKEGMQDTATMKGRHGRAGWHQDRSVGVVDAGATAMYYLIESFVRHLGEQIQN